MERQQLPDAVNCSIDSNFTQIPNTLIRNPNLSSKAKIILCILLSNKKGWKSHLMALKQMMSEGRDAIQNGLKELEDFGYLKRIQYRSQQTKIWKGSFWAYTNFPYTFDVENHIQYLLKCGLEPQPEKPDTDLPDTENPPLIILKRKNTNKESVKFLNGTKEKNIPIKENRIIPPPLELVINYCQKRKNLIDPEEFFRFYNSKDWMIGKNKMKDWHDAIITWEKREQKDKFKNKPKCVYQDNIRYNLCPDGRYRHPESGELYIP